MWNHAQNCLPSGDDDTTEPSYPGLQDRLEKSLDLTQYLKYLDQLFSLGTSESESSDSDDGERTTRTRTFTDFLQPPAQSLLPPPPYSHHHHLILGPSSGGSAADSSLLHLNHHHHHFSGLRPPGGDNFHLESNNISSSSLSSIDSGTSSLSLNLSTETFSETTLAKAEEAASAIPLNENNSSNSSAAGNTEDDKPGGGGGGGGEGSSDRNKKSQKKKKNNKGNSESLPKQNKPSSGFGGKDNNNGSKWGGGGGGGGGSGGQSSGSNNGSSDNNSSSNNSNSGGGSSSTGSSSQNNNMGGGGGSPGAKSRSLQPESSSSLSSSSCSESNMNSSIRNLDSHLSSILDSPDVLLQLNGDEDEHFSNELGGDSFDSHGMDAYPITALLDIQEDENSLSDYISMATPLSIPSTSMSDASSPMSQSSTNFFSKVAATAAASSGASNSSRNNNVNNNNNNNGQHKEDALKSIMDSICGGKKRKLEGLLVKSSGPPQDKFAKLTKKQRLNRIKFLDGKRRKIYVSIGRKEVAKKQRTMMNSFKESLVMKKKLAHACARQVRKTVVQSNKCVKDSVCRAKKLTQEMEQHWKMVERAERDLVRQKEKESEDKLKTDMATLRRKKEERKLNGLVTQVGLFAWKLLNPSGSECRSEDKDILQNLDEVEEKDKNDGLDYLDDYDSEKVKSDIQANTDSALKDHRSLVSLLDMSGMSPSDADSFLEEVSQPQMFEGVLNTSQIYGMSWLTKMYCHGLNGILVEENGGPVHKNNMTHQVIGFMSHLAEGCGLWGPFLIVAPPESLESWELEMDRMSPGFKVVPYWGKPMERKSLRQGWNKTTTRLHLEESAFHVVITSYQVMMTDLKYVSKVKWQYLIVDDCQGAITSSTKWMPLLSFPCRSKLLLSSSLRWASVPHLCSYLYFLMPSLFDSQEAFSEWLLKELESTSLDIKPNLDNNDDKIAVRLGSVVKRFMLDCNNSVELGKGMIGLGIDIQLYCSPSRRQRRDYSSLLEEADLNKIVANLEICPPDEVRRRVETVLNLSARLMKICNHPDLLEDERSSFSPYWMESVKLSLPKLIYEEGSILLEEEGRGRLKSAPHLFSMYSADNVHSSLFKNESVTKSSNPGGLSSTWSFARILSLSCGEVEGFFTKPSWSKLINLVNFQSVLEKLNYERIWRRADDQGGNTTNSLVPFFPERFLHHCLSQSEVLSNLVFATATKTVPNNYNYSWGEARISSSFSIPETIEHRRLNSSEIKINLNHKFLRRMMMMISSRRTELLKFPQFLHCFSEPVLSEGIQMRTFSKKDPNKRKTYLSEVVNCILEGGASYEPVAESLRRAVSEWDWKSQLNLPGFNQMISDSGKLKRLDGLLTSLKRSGASGVLLCSFVEGSVDILRDFLQFRRWKYNVLGERRNVDDDDRPLPFVYVVNALRPLPATIPVVDTVVFFDQDWNTRLEEQKERIVSKLGHSSTQVSCYRMLCRGTIEERLMRLSKDRNGLIFQNEALENLNGSCIPSLKGLVSMLLLSGNGQSSSSAAAAASTETCSSKQRSQSNSNSEKMSFNPDMMDSVTSYAKDDERGDAVEMEHVFDYVNGDAEESDSASPIYSEGLDSNEMDRDHDMDMKDCQEDHFTFHLDEGYMGMSPEFEEIGIKSDYEEDSSPKKYRLGRGSGKRGRPPSRRNFIKRDHALDVDSSMRRGPGRPRLKTVGPLNQGMRGKRPPGRPPLTKKAETISSGLTSHMNGGGGAAHQRVFGFYSSPDLELS